MSRFPNKAGDHADTDEILRAELKAAGIPTLQEDADKPPEFFAELLREQSGEVKTSVMGVLHGWTFKRAWYYWTAEGPGIEVTAAEALHATHGQQVRVAGHCGCPSPTEWFKGLAVGDYHVDTPDGLKALADTIKALVSRPKEQPMTTIELLSLMRLLSAMESAMLASKIVFPDYLSDEVTRHTEILEREILQRTTP